MKKSFDVIIPVGANDVSFVSKVVSYIMQNIKGVNSIYIITSLCYVSKLRQNLKVYSNCIVLNEDTLVSSLSLKRIQSIIVERGGYKLRSGWYFQQFLKLAFAYSKYCGDYYLSWDADTLPLSDIVFFEGDNILFNPKKEYHAPYFVALERLLGFGKVYEHSFIAEHMMFSRKIVCEMLDAIEKSKIEGTDWIDRILNACDFKKHTGDFSEFETYGSYCYVKYPELYKPRHLNTFREAGYISGRFIDSNRLANMSFDLDTASFEMQHFPRFPYSFPNIIWKIKNKLRKIFYE